LGIAGSNLDEFFMVRVATLLKKFRAGMDDVSPDGLHTEQQLVAIRQRASQMLDDMATSWQELLRPLLEAEGIRFLEPSDYTPEIRAHLAHHLNTDIWTVLTSQTISHRTSVLCSRRWRSILAARSRTSRTSVTVLPWWCATTGARSSP